MGNYISSNFTLEIIQTPFPPVLLVDSCEISQCDIILSNSIKACQLFADNFLGKISVSFGKIDHEGYLYLDNVDAGNDLLMLIR